MSTRPGGHARSLDSGLSRRNPVLRPPGSANISLTARRAPAGPAAPSTDNKARLTPGFRCYALDKTTSISAVGWRAAAWPGGHFGRSRLLRGEAMPDSLESPAVFAGAAERPNIFVAPDLGRDSGAHDGARSDAHGVFASSATAAAHALPARPSGRSGSRRAGRRTRRRCLPVIEAAGSARVVVAVVFAVALLTLIGLGFGLPAERSSRPAISRPAVAPAKVAEPRVVRERLRPRRPSEPRQRRSRRGRRPAPRRPSAPHVAARQPSAPLPPPRSASPAPAPPAPRTPTLPAPVPAGAPPEFM
jgi:hypothetical protein